MPTRAFVFAEHQIEPALTGWFGSQRFTTEQELEFRERLQAFLFSPEAAALRMPQYDPPPAGDALVKAA